jgi:hypothetical protein
LCVTACFEQVLRRDLNPDTPMTIVKKRTGCFHPSRILEKENSHSISSSPNNSTFVTTTLLTRDANAVLQGHLTALDQMLFPHNHKNRWDVVTFLLPACWNYSLIELSFIQEVGYVGGHHGFLGTQNTVESYHKRRLMSREFQTCETRSAYFLDAPTSEEVGQLEKLNIGNARI